MHMKQKWEIDSLGPASASYIVSFIVRFPHHPHVFNDLLNLAVKLSSSSSGKYGKQLLCLISERYLTDIGFLELA